ncbi:hypothetical protein R3P38DRAFT_2976268 [Favolaschia claudopus]|uniref:Uncharacterized protein n=1 Tax=Favolaschia claudopus TaxID=2862362 RepID=A0AAW0B024_9AGAR
MTSKRMTTELGHSAPPGGPHAITTHLPGWDTTNAFVNGEESLLRKLKSSYPRITPFGVVDELISFICQEIGFSPTHRCFPFLHPTSFSVAQTFALSPNRKGDDLGPADLVFKIVDIYGVRLYCVGYPPAKLAGINGIWQLHGVGVSTRLAEHLLKHTDTTVEVPFDVGQLPPPTYLPETCAHEQLRDRISSLLNRASVANIKLV